MRYIAYVRKSTEQGERQSLSVPAQQRKIKELFPNLEIVKWMEPESKSAFKPGRPIFNQMMELLLEGEAEGIISWHPDRLSRNEIDAAQITYGLRTGAIKDLQFGSYYFDNSPEGIMMLQSVMVHSQYYSSKLSKDVKRGNDEQRKRGWITGEAMEGYLNARNPTFPDQGIIIKDPQRFHLRRLMWELMLTGNYSVPAIAKIANEQWGYRTRGNKRYPSGPVSRNSLYHMFNNPRYAGKIPTPGKPDVYEQASYEPMVTTDEYDTVQDLLGRRGAPKLTPKKTFRYRGILLCGECGCLITAEEKHKRLVSGRTRTHIYYHCTRKRPCTQRKNITEKDIERQFTDLLGRYTILPQFKDWALEELGKQNERESTDCTEILKSQSRAIESKHCEIKELIAMAAKKLISHNQFSAEKKRLEREIKQLEKEREDTKKRASTWYETAERLFDLAVNGRERFIHGTVEEKRAILLNLGQNPVLLDGKLVITPHPWVVPIEEGYKQLEAKYEQVRTLPEHLQQGLMEAIRSMWLAIVNDIRTAIIVHPVA